MRHFLNLAVFAGFLIGVAVIAFLVGFSTRHYRLPPADGIIRGFTAAEAWRSALFTPNALPPRLADIKGYMRHPNVRWDGQKAWNGYTLINTELSPTAYLADMEGRIVHQWDMPFSKAWPLPSHVRVRFIDATRMEKAMVFANGDLIATYTNEKDTPYGYGLVKMDKNSNVLWTYSGHTHHDFYVDRATGVIYALDQEMIETPVARLEHLSYPVLDNGIVVLLPDGKAIKRISLLRAFRDSPFYPLLYHETRKAHHDWDVLHANSIAMLEPDIAARFPQFKPGYLLVSLRNLNTLAVIDPDSRKVVWAYNGLWKRQHSASFLANGHILLYDNKGHVVRNDVSSRIFEIDPATLSIRWSYGIKSEQRFFSEFQGRVQRLANGNTLITVSYDSRILEVTPEGRTVWEYKIGNGADIRPVIFSAIRYAPESLPFLEAQKQPMSAR